MTVWNYYRQDVCRLDGFRLVDCSWHVFRIDDCRWISSRQDDFRQNVLDEMTVVNDAVDEMTIDKMTWQILDKFAVGIMTKNEGCRRGAYWWYGSRQIDLR